MKKLKIILLLVCAVLCLTACIESTDPSAEESTSAISVQTENSTVSLPEDELAVHFFDVGQGDSVFLEFPDDTCMLIDASVSEYGDKIIQTISELGYERIDYVIATHPHADHIGGMTKVLEHFEVGCIYLPDVSTSTNTYIKMAETILEQEIDAKVAEAGVVLFETETLRAEFLAPFTIDDSDQNRNSAVMLLTYGETKFLFMGDADTQIEEQLGKNVQCDVLKVGHHGSRTASGEQFLQYARPTYAVISCGEGNSYSHPHEEALERLGAIGAEILRTDLLGDITVCSDGTTVSVYYGGETSSESSPSESTVSTATWILNTRSLKIHTKDCEYAAEISEKNRLESNLTIEELLQEGYTTCGVCKPQD